MIEQSKEERRRRKREERRIEKRYAQLKAASKALRSAEPIDGLYTVAGVTFDEFGRDEKLAELDRERKDMITQMMQLFPEEFIQLPNGHWVLRENAQANAMQ